MTGRGACDWSPDEYAREVLRLAAALAAAPRWLRPAAVTEPGLYLFVGDGDAFGSSVRIQSEQLDSVRKWSSRAWLYGPIPQPPG